MHKNILLIALFISLVIGCSSSKQGVRNQKLSPSELIKMSDARHLYLSRKYRPALNKYRDIFKKKKNVAILNYRIAECHAHLGNRSLAVEYFTNAVKLDSDVDKDAYLEYGKALLHNNQLNRAKDAFKKFEHINSERYVEKSKVDYYLAQVKKAKQLIKHPVDVKIINMGSMVNSRFGDYGASLTADGKTMIFTSRRQDTKGGKVDVEGDNKYFEDVYISKWDSLDKDWTRSHPIKGRVNTEGHDACLSISKDGKKIFVYRNDGKRHIGDIFVSKYSDYTNSWGTPKPLNSTVNTSYFESSASLTADGKYLYFVSERKGGYGHSDIYVAKKIKDYTYAEPRNLGSVINTKYDELSVFIHPDGKTLFFSSKGHGTMGGYDIFMSSLKEDSTWTKPKNIGYPINTVNDDLHFSIMPNNKTAYYDAVRKGGNGGRDIYKIDLSNYSIMKDNETKLAAVKGKITGYDSTLTNFPQVKFIDLKTNKLVQEVDVDGETGDYYTTIEADKKYKITIDFKGFKPIEKVINLNYNPDKINTLQIDFKLEKKGEEK